MILVDTSVWIHFLRRGDAHLAELLDGNAVVMHPFILGEIACGNLGRRKPTLELLQDLPAASVAGVDEIPCFIERNRLYGRGIGYVDVHLLASVAQHLVVHALADQFGERAGEIYGAFRHLVLLAQQGAIPETAAQREDHGRGGDQNLDRQRATDRRAQSHERGPAARTDEAKHGN